MIYTWRRGDPIPVHHLVKEDPGSVVGRIIKDFVNAVQMQDDILKQLGSGRDFLAGLDLLPCWLSFQFRSIGFTPDAKNANDKAISLVVEIGCDDRNTILIHESLPKELRNVLNIRYDEDVPGWEAFRVIGHDLRVDCILSHRVDTCKHRPQHIQQRVFHYLQAIRRCLKAIALGRLLQLRAFTLRFQETNMPLENMMESILNEAATLTGAWKGSLWYSQPDKSDGFTNILYGFAPEESEEISKGNLPRKITAEYFKRLEARKIRLIPDVKADSTFIKNSRVSLTGGAIHIPLKLKDRLLGLLCLDSKQKHHFTVFDLLFAEMIGVLAVQPIAVSMRSMLLKELEEQFNVVLAAKKRYTQWLDEIGKKTPEVDYIALQILNLESGMIETITVRGKNVNPRSFLFRHHSSSNDIHASLIREPQVEVIRGGDKRFDPIIFRSYGHDEFERLYIPLFSSGTRVELNAGKESQSDNSGSSDRKIYPIKWSRGRVIGNLEFGINYRSDGSKIPWLTKAEIGKFSEPVWPGQHRLGDYDIVRALEVVSKIIREITSSKLVKIRLGSYNKDTNFIEVQSPAEQIDLVNYKPEIFPIKIDEEKISECFVWSLDGSHNQNLVEPILLEMRQFLRALRQERAYDDQSEFQLVLSDAVTRLYNNRNMEDFLKLVSTLALHFMLSEWVTVHSEYSKNRKDTFLFTKSNPFGTEKKPPPLPGQVDRKLLSYKLHEDTKAPSPNSPDFQDPLSSLPRKVIIRQSYVPNSYYPKNYYKEIKRILQFHVQQALETFWRDQQREDMWIKRLEALNEIHGDSIHSLFSEASKGLATLDGYLGCAFNGYDDVYSEFYFSFIDGIDQMFTTRSHKHRVAAEWLHTAGQKMRLWNDAHDRYRVNIVEQSEGLFPGRISELPFRKDLKLVFVVPKPVTTESNQETVNDKQDVQLFGTTLHHLSIAFRKMITFTPETVQFLGNLTVQLTRRIRDLEDEEIDRYAREAEQALFSAERTKNLVETAVEVFGRIREVKKVIIYKETGKGAFEVISQKSNIEDNTLKTLNHIAASAFRGKTSSFQRVKEHEVLSLPLLLPNQAPGVLILLGSSLSPNDAGFTPFHRRVVSRLVGTLKAAVSRVDELEVLRFRAAQVAHAAKSTLGGLQDDTDLMSLRLSDPEKYHNINPIDLCAGMVKRIDQAKKQILATVQNTETLPEITVDFRQIIERITSGFGNTAERRGIKFFLNPSIDRIPPIRAVKSLLEILLNNLVENAVKYSWNGKTVKIFAGGKNLQRLCVQNYGEGIPDTIKGEVYKPGFRGPARRRRHDAGGLGIGLYTARQAAKKLGILIYFQSSYQGISDKERDEGTRYLTTFWLEFTSLAII